MARTHKKVGYSPTGKLEDVTPDMAARGVEEAFRMLEGRWKMVIIFHLFARSTLRFSELEKAIPGVSQKMLIQQLRELERDGIVSRTVYPQVPTKVEYTLTKWGQRAYHRIVVEDANVLCARKPSGVVTTKSVLVAVAWPM